MFLLQLLILFRLLPYINALDWRLEARVQDEPLLIMREGNDESESFVKLDYPEDKVIESIMYYSESGKAYINHNFEMAFYTATCEDVKKETNPKHIKKYDPNFNFPAFSWNHGAGKDLGKVRCIVISNTVLDQYIRREERKKDVQNWHATVGDNFKKYLWGGGFIQSLCDIYGRMCHYGYSIKGADGVESLRKVRLAERDEVREMSLIEQEAEYLWPSRPTAKDPEKNEARRARKAKEAAEKAAPGAAVMDPTDEVRKPPRDKPANVCYDFLFRQQYDIQGVFYQGTESPNKGIIRQFFLAPPIQKTKPDKDETIDTKPVEEKKGGKRRKGRKNSERKKDTKGDEGEGEDENDEEILEMQEDTLTIESEVLADAKYLELGDQIKLTAANSGYSYLEVAYRIKMLWAQLWNCAVHEGDEYLKNYKAASAGKKEPVVMGNYIQCFFKEFASTTSIPWLIAKEREEYTREFEDYVVRVHEWEEYEVLLARYEAEKIRREQEENQAEDLVALIPPDKPKMPLIKPQKPYFSDVPEKFFTENKLNTAQGSQILEGPPENGLIESIFPKSVRATLVANQKIIVQEILSKINSDLWKSADETKDINFLNLVKYIRDKDPFKKIQLGMPFAHEEVYGGQEGLVGPLSVEAAFIQALQVIGFDATKYYLFRKEFFEKIQMDESLPHAPGEGAKETPALYTNAQVLDSKASDGLSPKALARFQGCEDVVLQRKGRPIHTAVFVGSEDTKLKFVVPGVGRPQPQLVSSGAGLYSGIDILGTWNGVTPKHVVDALQEIKQDWNVVVKMNVASNEERKSNEEQVTDGYTTNAKYPSFTIHLVDRETAGVAYEEDKTDPAPIGGERRIWGLGFDQTAQKFHIPSGQGTGGVYPVPANNLKKAIMLEAVDVYGSKFTYNPENSNDLFVGVINNEQSQKEPKILPASAKTNVLHAHAHPSLYNIASFQQSFKGFAEDVAKSKDKMDGFKNYLNKLTNDGKEFCSYEKPGNAGYHMYLNTEARDEYPKAEYWKRMQMSIAA